MQCVQHQLDQTIVKDNVWSISYRIWCLSLNTSSLTISMNQFTFNIAITLIFHVIDKPKIIMPWSSFEEEYFTDSSRTNQISNSHTYTWPGAFRVILIFSSFFWAFLGKGAPLSSILAMYINVSKLLSRVPGCVIELFSQTVEWKLMYDVTNKRKTKYATANFTKMIVYLDIKWFQQYHVSGLF